MKTTKLNGNFTKEKLLEIVKTMDEPVWTIEEGKNRESGDYFLYKNGVKKETIGRYNGDFQLNYSQLIYKIAAAMGVLATKENILKFNTFSIWFDPQKKKFTEYIVGIERIGSILVGGINNGDIRNKIIDMITISPLMKEFE